jgi:N-succinyldiaminopimelate aminotransferase
LNPRLDRLQSYPFQKLTALLEGAVPNPAQRLIPLYIGEPKHPTPEFIKRALTENLSGLAGYPATAGTPELREAIAAWLSTRYGIPPIDATTQVIPVTGTREALFAIAQAVVDTRKPDPVVVCPNPFYQIYEGSALLAGARPVFANSAEVAGARGRFETRWLDVAEADWAKTQLLYVCSPGNPTGSVAGLDEWRLLFDLSDRHGFVIASDECYSEIYFGDQAPLGALDAAQRLGRADFRRVVVLTSLSKRSNVPGMRSGFVAGDAAVLKSFLLYRTYHGSAMSPPVQQASIAAWSDEAHVVANRALYRAKFDAVLPTLSESLDVGAPDAGLYLWAKVPGGDDIAFARGLLAQYNVAVLPGSLLARESQGANPGAGRIRLALVAGLDECIEAARRIVRFVASDPT